MSRLSEVIYHGRRAGAAPPRPIAVRPTSTVVEEIAAPAVEAAPPLRPAGDLHSALAEEAGALARLLRAQAEILEQALESGTLSDAMQVHAGVTAALKTIIAKDRLLVAKLQVIRSQSD